MTDMKRINDRFALRESDGESDAYRRFSHQFSQLFNSGDKAHSDEEFQEMYVHDESFEQSLNEFRNSEGNLTRFVVGYTGIGKSTTIRYVFSIGIGRRPFYNPNTKEVVFPTFLDGFQEKPDGKFNLVARIRSANSMLQKTFPDLAELLRTDKGKAELYSFFEEHAGYVLEECDAIDELDWTEEERIREKLRAASKKESFEYHATLFKFLIYKKYDAIRRLIIIIDDIETFSDNYQEEIIQSFMKLNDCMGHTTYPTRSSEQTYAINLLISMRPHTFRRHIAGRYKNREIEAFPINKAIKKTHPVSIIELFKKRFAHYTKGVEIKEIDTWRECYRELEMLLEKFESFDGKYNGKYINMIYGLCFYDVRLTLAWYAKLFANRQWVQRGIPKADAFTVRESEFVFNNNTVIRTLSCKENKVFFDNSSDIVPNPFYTTHKKDLGILSLLVLKYFHVKTKHDEYGANPQYETLAQIMHYWRIVCGKHIADDVRKVVYYYYDIKLLRPSIQNTENWGKDDGHSSKLLKDDTVLYLSPRGFQIYEMFGKDSLLLELVREASYRDYSWKEFNLFSSYELVSQGRQREVFADLLDYLSYLSEKEEEIRNRAIRRGKEEKYSSVFGRSSACDHLMQGVYNSLKYTSLIHDSPSVMERYSEVAKKLALLNR